MDLSSPSLISHQSFFSVVKSGSLENLKTLIHKLTANEDTSNKTIRTLMALQNNLGETALFIAADANFEDMFSYLLKICDLETAMIRTKADMSAFHVAAKRGNLGIAKEMLSIWPEICKACDSTNTSPLYSACVQDRLDVVNAILDADATSTRIVRKNGKTSLHTAARYGLLRIVIALLRKDPGIVHVKDKKGQNSLHMAVKGQSSSAVEEILLVDPSILNERDKKGNTAVHVATRKCRVEILNVLLSYTNVDVNCINSRHETAMDLADALQYSESTLQIKEALAEAGAMNAKHIHQVEETVDLKRTVSDIRHEVQSQLIQNETTHKRVTGIAKDLRKLHREAVQNTTNSVTLVAVLFASTAFLAIFNLPGQYVTVRGEDDTGEANISYSLGFRLFCLLNATSLFISLAVVVVQITLVAWNPEAQKLLVSVINKLMWAACISTCASFLAIAFVVVGKRRSWMAVSITVMGAPILLTTLVCMCYFVFRQHFGRFRILSQTRVKRGGVSKSLSWSIRSAYASEAEAENDSDIEKIYGL